MNTRTKRFMHAVLGEGRDAAESPETVRRAGLPHGGFQLRSMRVWPFGDQTGMRIVAVESPATCGGERLGELVISACFGGGLAEPELAAGLDLQLPPVEPDRVAGRSEHLLGQLVSPETTPETRGTVEVDFAELLPQGPGFGLVRFGIVKLRARVAWAVDGRHVLHFERQMPTGWPGGKHHETDESAISGRTGRVAGRASVCFGVPVLTDDRTCVVECDVNGLDQALGALKALARG